MTLQRAPAGRRSKSKPRSARAERRDPRGFSLVELLLATAMSITLFGASGSVFLASVASMQHVNRQGDVDSLYLVTLQGLRNVALLKKLIAVTPGSDLSNCLSGLGADCTGSLQPVRISDAGMVGMFGVNGRCGSDTDVPNPLCNTRVSASYQWVCGDPANCTNLSALQINVSVQPLNSDGSGESTVVARTGAFSVPSTAFTSKKPITMQCASSGVFPLKGFNYATYTDECQYIANDAPCAGPSKIYGEVITCQSAQDAPSCGDGFSTSGLYVAQNTCPPGVSAPYVPPLAMTGQTGGYGGLPPAPDYGYYPDPPPPPPPPPSPSPGPSTPDPAPDPGPDPGPVAGPPPPPPPPAPDPVGHWGIGNGAGSFWCDGVNPGDTCSPIGAQCWHRAGLNWMSLGCN